MYPHCIPIGYTMPTNYTTVKIPVDLAKAIQDLVKKKKLGYRSTSEFVVETVRKRVEEELRK